MLIENMFRKILMMGLIVLALVASVWIISSRAVSHTGLFLSTDFYINLDAIGFVIFGGVVALSAYTFNLKRDASIFAAGGLIGLLVEFELTLRWRCHSHNRFFSFSLDNSLG